MADADDQASAESLDETMLGADESDSSADAGEFPPEHALGAEEYGTRGVEEQIPESLTRREARLAHDGESEGERPDVDPGASVGALLDDSDDEGFDAEADLVATMGDEEDPPSAEEAAMHVTSEPPYAGDDSYLDDDR